VSVKQRNSHSTSEEGKSSRTLSQIH